MNDEAQTVFLYHHVYKMPFTTSAKCNHFAHMWEVEICSNKDKNCVNYGGSDLGEVVDFTITTPVTRKPKTSSLRKRNRRKR